MMQASPYVLPLLLAAIVMGALAGMAWQRRAARGALALVGVMLGCAEWALAAALQWASASPEAQLFWYRARFVGTELIAASYLAFALQYLGHSDVTRRLGPWLFVMPALSLTLLWTNDAHHLFLGPARQASLPGFAALDITYGPWFWVHTAYDYALLSAALLLFAGAYFRAPRLYRWQILSLVVAALAPLGANLLTVTGRSPFPYLDLTPFGFAISALALAGGFIGFGVLDIVPAARDAVIHSLDDAVLVLDQRQRLVDVNPAGVKLLNQPAAALIGRPIAGVLPAWTSVAGQASSALLQLPAPSGSPSAAAELHDYEARSTPIVDRSGRVTGCVLLVRDLTERRLVEASLRQSQTRFEEVIESIADAYYETDLNGVLTYTNSVFARAIGYTREAIIGQSFRRFTDRQNARDIYRAFHQVYESGQPVDRVGYRFRRSDNTDVYAELSIALRKGEDGSPVGFRGLIRDVTAQRQAEEALRQSEEKYRTILDNIEDGYYEIDRQGNFTLLTDVTAKIAGMTREAALGHNFADFTDAANAGALLRVYNRVYRTGEPVKNVGYSITAPDGTRKFLEASASLIRDASGAPVGFRGIIRDMTERRRAEEELQRAKEAAEAASQAKSVFLTTVSHELRTPLTSVLGFAKLIKKRVQEVLLPAVDASDRRIQRASQQVMTNLDIIVSEGERLTALINNLLDLAKIEAGKVDWNMQPVAVGDVIARAVAATTALAEHKHLHLGSEVSADLPLVIGDQDRLIQVVINLISNAVKFTERGSVTCRARSEAGGILVSVSDTGVGIAPEDRERVFDQFVQVGNTLTDKPTGTGLGLPICKQIVEHHGGRIWVESQVGQGSTFAFWLPVRAAPSQRPEPEVTRGLDSIEIGTLIQQLKERVSTATETLPAARKHVLIVDDDRSIRELLRQEFEADGYTVREAADGREALAYVKQSAPDLIVLDVMMPELSGFDVAAVLRSDPDTRRIPIIILSVIRDRERGYRVGVDRYFTKPVDAEALLQEVNRLLARGPSQKSVLVVDEDVTVVQTLSDVLQAQGYSVAGAYDGREGLAKAISTRPDLVIVNSVLSEQAQLVQTLRFEKGLEHVSFLLFH